MMKMVNSKKTAERQKYSFLQNIYIDVVEDTLLLKAFASIHIRTVPL